MGNGHGAFLDLAARELEQIGLIDRRDGLDGTVVRVSVPKAYPAYFGNVSRHEGAPIKPGRF